MSTVKVYAGFIASFFLAVAAVLAIVSVHNRQVFPAQRAAHMSLQEALWDACSLPPAEFDALAARAVQSNYAVWNRHVRQRDSWLGDMLTPDGWENVRYVVIPNEQECAKHVASAEP